ncbi:MAG: hypothetical protein NC548_10685 [Lachnospiraceae bacterium]|nr:hypothetical protein [Lachnospiraceae bacterium]
MCDLVMLVCGFIAGLNIAAFAIDMAYVSVYGRRYSEFIENSDNPSKLTLIHYRLTGPARCLVQQILRWEGLNER